MKTENAIRLIEKVTGLKPLPDEVFYAPGKNRTYTFQGAHSILKFTSQDGTALMVRMASKRYPDTPIFYPNLKQALKYFGWQKIQEIFKEDLLNEIRKHNNLCEVASGKLVC